MSRTWWCARAPFQSNFDELRCHEDDPQLSGTSASAHAFLKYPTHLACAVMIHQKNLPMVERKLRLYRRQKNALVSSAANDASLRFSAVSPTGLVGECPADVHELHLLDLWCHLSCTDFESDSVVDLSSRRHSLFACSFLHGHHFVHFELWQSVQLCLLCLLHRLVHDVIGFTSRFRRNLLSRLEKLTSVSDVIARTSHATLIALSVSCILYSTRFTGTAATGCT